MSSHTKIKTNESVVKDLGFNFIYHFNDIQNLWYCIPRDKYLHYWGNIHNKDYTSGNTLEEAAERMLKKQ